MQIVFDEHWPDLPGGRKKDYKKAEMEDAQRRLEAVKNEHSLDGLIRLAEQTKNPWLALQ